MLFEHGFDGEGGAGVVVVLHGFWGLRRSCEVEKGSDGKYAT